MVKNLKYPSNQCIDFFFLNLLAAYNFLTISEKRAGGQNIILGITLEIINLNHYNVLSGDINVRILINLSHIKHFYGLYSPKNVITGGAIGPIRGSDKIGQ